MRNSGFRFPILNTDGVALIMVLWVVAILSVIVLEFCFAMRTEVNIAKNFKEEAQLRAMAEGGIQRAIAELIYKSDPRIQQMRKNFVIEEIPPDKREWMTDGRPYRVSFEQGTCDVCVRSEGAKVNLNTVSDASLRRIMGQLGLEGEARDVVVDSILDWRDPDDFTRVNGAENDYYQSLKEPYYAKNRNFDSVEELLLVRGVTPDLFYGRKGSPKGEGEGVEEPGERAMGLKDIFSIYSSGEQVDINSAAAPVLRIALGLPAAVAQAIVRAREEKAFQNPQDLLQRVPELSPFMTEAGRYILFQSAVPYYTIEARARGKEGRSTQGVKAIVKIDRREKNGYKVIQWVDRLM